MISLILGVLIGIVFGAKLSAHITPVLDGIWAKIVAKFAA